MSDQTTYQKLAERFPAGDHKTRQQGGRDLTYLPGEKVIGRLNGVLGFDWSFRVVNQGATDIEAWVLGELTATIDGVSVTRQQYGNQDLARGQRATTDLYKSAATDALKKAATTIGVGLYLYDEDERREVEAEMRAEKRIGGRPKPEPTTTDQVRAAAMVTGAVETTQQRWQRLVSEAEAAKYPRAGMAAVVDPKAVSEAQLKSYADRLEANVAEWKKQGAA